MNYNESNYFTTRVPLLLHPMGDYTLVADKNWEPDPLNVLKGLYRLYKGRAVPDGMKVVEHIFYQTVYQEDRQLLPRYWVVPRVRL